MKRRFTQGESAVVVTSTAAAGPHHAAFTTADKPAIEAAITASVLRNDNGDVLVEQGGLWRRVRISNVGDTVWIDQRGRRLQLQRQDASRGAQAGGASDNVSAPMTGRVVVVNVAVGDVVTKGQPLVVVEAMKMEQPMLAPRDGVVAKVACTVGQLVDGGYELVVLQKVQAGAAEAS